jgi:hypothetical protein
MSEPLAFVTMSSIERLPGCRVLIDSIRRFHPQSPIVLWKLGDYPDPSGVTKSFQLKSLQEMAQERGRIWLNAMHSYKKAVFLGADCELYSPFNEVESMLDQHDFLIVPHILRPFTPEDEVRVYRTGIGNADFVAFRRSLNTSNMLSWLMLRLNKFCLHAPEKGFFNEQIWCSMLPYLFDKAHFWRTTRFNVGWWNWQLYNLREENGQWLTDDGPLAMFHFSGFRQQDPAGISVYTQERAATGIVSLFEEYAAKVRSFS